MNNAQDVRVHIFKTCCTDAFICIVLITACYNYIMSFLSTFVISITFVSPHTVFVNVVNSLEIFSEVGKNLISFSKSE